MQIITSECDLIYLLRQNLNTNQSLFIGVDSFMGSGKSRLAMRVASALGGFRLSLDSYIDTGSNGPRYINKLLLDYFLEDVVKHKGNLSCIVVEGICLLEATEAVKLNVDFLIYIKRISTQGIWHDGYHLEDYETGKLYKGNDLELLKSVFDYHLVFEPQKRANIIFERTETDEE